MSNNEPIYEYDSNGRMTYYKDSNGYEGWREYDANGNCIHYKDSNGLESWHEYDANKNLIYYKKSHEIEYWYDSDGNEIDKPATEAYNINMNTTTIDLPKPKFTADSLELFSCNSNRDQIAKLMNTLISEVVHRMYGTYHPVDVQISVLQSAIDREFKKHPQIATAGGEDSEPHYAIERYLKRIVGGVNMIYGIKNNDC